MTVLSGQTILRMGLVFPCHARSDSHGMTYGLGPAGYDLRLDLGVFADAIELMPGGFMLAAAQEHFSLPNNVLGVVHDKSSWARQGLCCQNTVLEPGWNGYATLELTNHGTRPLVLEKGAPIAQVVFHLLDEPTEEPYSGKYQNQAPGPQAAR